MNNNEGRTLFWAILKFRMPVATSVQLYAESKEAAIETLKKAHTEVSDFEIVDIYPLTPEQEQAAIDGMMQETQEKVIN